MKAAIIPELLLLNRLLIQKLEEVARAFKDKAPEVYRALGFGELVGRGTNSIKLWVRRYNG